MLTAKQQHFVDAYMVSFNGTQAAIRAGYSVKTARAIASENLRKPEIAAEIARRTSATRARSEVHRLETINQLGRIAFADIRGIFDGRGEIKNPKDWPREAWDGIESVRFAEPPRSQRGGKQERAGYRVGIKMANKLKALYLLATHYGLISPRRRPKRPNPPNT